MGPVARLSKVDRNERGCRASNREAAPSLTTPRANMPTTTAKNTAALFRFPRYRCPRPGTSQAKTQDTNGAAAGWAFGPACSTSVSLTGLLLDDPDLHFGGDLGVQAHRDGVNPQALDRLGKLDAPLVH